MSKYRGNLVHIAEAVRSHGRGGDDILVHVNPDEFRQMQDAWGEHSVNPHTGLPEYGLFSKLKKALKFENFNVKKIVKGVVDDPSRLIFGIDPLGTKIGNKVMNDNKDPLVNQLGGATKQTFQEAQAKGYDTGLAQDLHKAAGAIAALYAAGAASGLGGAGGAAGSGSGLGAATTGAGSGLGAGAATGAGAGAAGAAGAGAAASALPEVVVSAAGGSGLGGGATLSGLLGAGSAMSSLGSSGSAISDGVQPIDTSILDTGLPESVQGAGSPGLGQQAWDYAKQPGNWPTIAKGATALTGLAGAAGGGGSGGPPPYDPGPGYTVDTQYPGRQFNPGDYSKYYNYGEGPEHQYYTYGTTPEELQAPEGQGYARGGRMHYSGLGAPLSNEPRYVQDGPGSGRGDEIDAKLSPKEYVMDAETVALLGDGNPDFGAKKLDEMRRKIRMHKGKKLAKGQFSHKAKNPEGYL